MAATVEFEKMTNGSVRYKWSNQATSQYIVNPTNVNISGNEYAGIAGNSQINIFGTGFYFNLNRTTITTINGVAVPGTIEATLSALADDVFGG